MKVEKETQIWHCAAAHYGESLISIVNGALKSFRRVPGLDVLTRIHKVDVGAAAFTILDLAIPKTGMPWSDGSFIHAREQLRSHLSRYVLKRLVDDNAAPPELRDRLLAIDLGL
ncbi:hypothetical protein ACIP02_17830 [Pseudomonas sp. NPDC089408]|uniref:hypothetical protein n=1 Tax=Pseudomonas sp. NPDC089408 TaxID=3364465 RepID=UPI0037F6B083